MDTCEERKVSAHPHKAQVRLETAPTIYGEMVIGCLNWDLCDLGIGRIISLFRWVSLRRVSKTGPQGLADVFGSITPSLYTGQPSLRGIGSGCKYATLQVCRVAELMEVSVNPVDLCILIGKYLF